MKPLMVAAVSLTLSAVALPAAAGHWWSANPHVSIGSTTINVRHKGAKGNGRHNDTAAFQAAINALPRSGGTVVVPAGRYMIDAKKSIRMHSHTRLKLQDGAELRVIPNKEAWHYAIRVWGVNNVKIVGGKITGERSRHRGRGGEWGMGIDIRGSKNVVVKDVHVSNFWGDGLYVGAKHGKRSDYVTINNVVSSNNRRQGLSITPASHVYVVNSTFKDTHGTLPQAGVDIEPQNEGKATNIRLENNRMTGNKGNGIELHNHISGITIARNQLTGNRGFGVLSVSGSFLNINGNHAARNGLAGVGLTGKAHSSSVRNNTLQYNSTRYMSPNRVGGGKARDIKIARSTYGITKANNKLSPKR
ncbi:right-handed parallel beta-helix repeat-containing protein [Frateuria hangzhouensis]|uniref:right-handed parallel beta-helix repeat-containing protein n=1 Tax=Frateuria hangzhouensis TaxID=2995589 RepID=UPI002260A8E5|nr:right-handed parallel beta-helix repeat-containing protein [Frateuria sp. STR12]MCX7513933.1 right-handed parallel beta-helix repeat-containing protein [Frateuria sp. STR12]